MKPKDLDFMPLEILLKALVLGLVGLGMGVYLAFDQTPLKALPEKTTPPQLGPGEELGQNKQRALRRIRRRQRRSLWH